MADINNLMVGQKTEKEFWENLDLFIRRAPDLKVTSTKLYFYTDETGTKMVNVDEFHTR